jgi:hypothetical protein
MLPRGWKDLLRQIVLFCGAYWLYRLVRGQVDGRAAAAFANAREIVDFERSLGLFVEPGIHGWAERHEWVLDAATWMYVNSHFVITTFTLAWLYLRRNERFYGIRDMFMVAMGIALVGYMVFPTAPPRFMPELGFQDPVAALTGAETANALVNPYAAVPSMHVAFALMLGVPMARIACHTWVRGLWCIYPLVVTFVVVSTANHWWFDAFLGAATAAVAALVAYPGARMAAAWPRLLPSGRRVSAASTPSSQNSG